MEIKEVENKTKWAFGISEYSPAYFILSGCKCT